MYVDESKIQELLEKEIQQQVAKKIKTIGRDTIIKIFEEEIERFLVVNTLATQLEITEKMWEDVSEHKEHIEKQVTHSVANKLFECFREGYKQHDYEEIDFDDDWD